MAVETTENKITRNRSVTHRQTKKKHTQKNKKQKKKKKKTTTTKRTQVWLYVTCNELSQVQTNRSKLIIFLHNNYTNIFIFRDVN